MQKIGHRGAKGHLTENTLESFQKAIDLGVDAIELDVHQCASGELIVFHDFTLERLTNGQGEISKFTWEQLQQLQIVSRFRIPTLIETLDLIDRKCNVNIELKGHHTAEATALVVEEFVQNKSWHYSDFIVSSFQYEELETFSNLNSKIPLAVLTQASVEQAVEWAKKFQASYIHPHFSLLTMDNCNYAKANDLKINTWTVNDPIDIEHVKRFTIDGIISDFPDRI
ncbi:MAG: glycerophosphodiester phosphodiesterase [Flavobacterium sp.]|uniref:glycerophosphodiester phosphodiesterase n=1 Tax=unclassified Flavobacterium TaxID=196869 RepID=UPI000C453AB2|nr:MULTISPECIES: glycerophosphodiester phosphodiesterase family protein [unclassified Flavobacterium]MBF02378.1 glycerophosphodiester phosphodiesterase [Flavobacterium sp.]MCO6161340.1 glycerophosphodiester phosphodiesterase [Flavobacterium sp. NRK F7]